MDTCARCHRPIRYWHVKITQGKQIYHNECVPEIKPVEIKPVNPNVAHSKNKGGHRWQKRHQEDLNNLNK